MSAPFHAEKTEHRHQTLEPSATAPTSQPLARSAPAMMAVPGRAFGVIRREGDDDGWETVPDNVDKLVKAAAKNSTKNFSMGSATEKEANDAGLKWVGENARPFYRQGRIMGYVSEDGLRQYRLPAQKASAKATTGVQANFERRSQPVGAWEADGHVNIRKSKKKR